MAKIKKYILLIITIIVISFIFIHSLMPADVSSDESWAVAAVLESILSALHIPITLTDHMVRKAAHFTEFFIFGFFLTRTVYAFCNTYKGQVFKILFFLLAVPVTDETLQYFSVGRSAQVNDVLLDFSGALTAFIVIIAAAALIQSISKKNSD